MLIKVLSTFFLPISLDKKRRGTKGVFSKKASSKATLLIFPLYNSSKNTFLLFPLYLLIVSSSFYLFAAKFDISVFSKDNAEKNRGDNPRNIGANTDRRTRANNSGIETNADVRINNPGTAADNPSIVANNLSIAANNLGIGTDDLSIGTNDPNTTANNSGITADNPGIARNDLDTGTDANARADSPGTAADNPGIEIDTDIEADNLSIAVSNKACVTSFFTLYYVFFLLASFSELVTTSLPSFLPFLSQTTL